MEFSPSQIFSPYDPVGIPEPGVPTPDKYRLGDLQDRYVGRKCVTEQVGNLAREMCGIEITYVQNKVAREMWNYVQVKLSREVCDIEIMYRTGR